MIPLWKLYDTGALVKTQAYTANLDFIHNLYKDGVIGVRKYNELMNAAYRQFEPWFEWDWTE